jgi:hypothetical protein
MRALKAHKISAATLLVAITLYLGAYAYYHRIDWAPVEIAFPALGTVVDGRFTADIDDTYNVIVEFNREFRPDYWICVYGATFPTDKCEGVSDRTIVEWSIKSGSSVVASGTASGLNRGAVWGNGYAGSTVTTLNTKSGQHYEIHASLRGPPRTIEETKPRLKVEAPALLHKGAFVITSVVTMLSYLIAAVGLVIFIVEYSRSALTRRSTRTRADNARAG